MTTMENIEVLKQEIDKVEQEFSHIKSDLRTKVINLMVAIVQKYNGKVDFYENEEFREECSFAIGCVTITYDGGRHPEYATNAFSEVFGVYLDNNKIFIDCEDCDAYSIDRIWSLDEVIAICDVLRNYDSYMTDLPDKK